MLLSNLAPVMGRGTSLICLTQVVYLFISTDAEHKDANEHKRNTKTLTYLLLTYLLTYNDVRLE